MSKEDVSVTERLMNTLITKMESMDSDLQLIKSENKKLRSIVDNPATLLRKAGFISTTTPLSEDVSNDAFRGEESLLLKNEPSYTNEEIHLMSWEEIHDMADQARSTKEVKA